MKVALIGATGNAGSRVLAELLSRGHSVTAVVRNPDRVAASDKVTARGVDGSSESLARSLGVITVVCTVLYAVPPTSILGAILLTGYLGGAMATHFRIGSPLFSHLLFGLYLGLFAWGGLYLRYPWLRRLMPVKA